jgi:putative transposase
VRVVTVAIDEGIINPLTLAHQAPDGAREVMVINGRSGRAIKRGRNKTVAKLSAMLSRCKNGSRRHRRLTAAKRKAQGKAEARLRDFNHQTTAKANKAVRAVHALHQAEAPDGVTVTMRVVVGDVRGIEQRTNQRRRVNRSTRQQLSQWERGIHEHQLAYKAGLKIEHINEAYTSQACPACGHRRKVRGRWYACTNETCGFRLHRDAVGGVNILTLADNDGTLVPAGPALRVRVTYLRAQPGWSPLQRELHGHHQRTLGHAGSGRQRSQ